MKIKRYILTSIIFLSLFACRESDVLPHPEKEDLREINVSGAFTRADGSSPEYQIYLRAILRDDVDNIKEYFHNKSFDRVSLGNQPAQLSLTTPQYYPLSGNLEGEEDKETEIYLYAFTNNLDNDKLKMNLRAGYDEILSNYGERETEGPGIKTSEEGEGAIGSSINPVKTLSFRHVMTQINVQVKITDNDFEGDQLGSLSFEMEELVAAGQYSLSAKSPESYGVGEEIDVATASTDRPYTMKLGTNYVVPTGKNLKGRPLTKLIIDDYEATPDDLAGFTIEKSTDDSKSTDLMLLPGYAYNLIFKIKRLKVTGIEVELTKWKEEYVENDNISFVPQILKVDFTKYYNDNTNEPINKIVLYSEIGGEIREYVGTPGGNNPQKEMEFTLLPDMITGIELYTDKGLLLREEGLSITIYNQVTNSYSLEFHELEKNGMMKNPQGYYEVTTPAQFMKIGKELDGNYLQTNDLELDALELTEELPSFGEFKGEYDGQWFRISQAKFKGGGLFTTNSGTIKNMRIASGTIDLSPLQPGDYAGSICQVNKGEIIGCVNEARIINAQAGVIIGGICGKNENKITGCVNNGNIQYATVAGGICGENSNTNSKSILACVNTGKIGEFHDETNVIGGICGKRETASNQTPHSCFWLNGTAAKKIGETEFAVGSDTVSGTNADVSPNKLQDENGICKVLNEALEPGSEFKFIVNRSTTGSVWPIPVKQN